MNAVEKGDISPLIGFGSYKDTAEEIEDKLVGITTNDGIKIEGYVNQFVDRVIGQTEQAYKGKREGVFIGKVKDVLENGKAQPVTINKNKVSKKYISDSCAVALNPDTKMLIQANP